MFKNYNSRWEAVKQHLEENGLIVELNNYLRLCGGLLDVELLQRHHLKELRIATENLHAQLVERVDNPDKQVEDWFIILDIFVMTNSLCRIWI